MPSIIVETAFHTNPDDAKALLDPVFRSAAMKGVEKGYRLWATGKACETLALDPLADVQIPVRSSRFVPVVFKGNPQYPLVLELSVASCVGGNCTPSDEEFMDPGQPVQLELLCNGDGVGTVRWRTRLRDADGVVTEYQEFNQSCVLT